MPKKQVIFLDRDGTLIGEPPEDFQNDSLEKLEYIPGVFRNLFKLRHFTDFKLVIVSNQDGLGTHLFPREDFDLVQNKFLRAFENEGIIFDAIHIDPSLPADNSPNRKPLTGMLGEYLNGDYDLPGSYVIGDRSTDIQLAQNLGSKAIFFRDPGSEMVKNNPGLAEECVLLTDDWDEIYRFIRSEMRKTRILRETAETNVEIELSLDGEGRSDISTGLGFFDHMLDQLSRHGGFDLKIYVTGDLNVDEHHTVEDTALALGEAFRKAIGSKRGLERYGYLLPMDDSLARVAIDFGGRPWIVWNAEFKREKVGDLPTEMFFHFFKSFSDAARCNLNIEVTGKNEHHKIEAVFKGFARALKQAVQLDPDNNRLPSTKEML